MGAATSRRQTTMTEHHDTDYEPHHESSPTDHVLQELALYGYRPFEDEPDPRPLPEGNVVAGSIAARSHCLAHNALFLLFPE